MSVLGCRSAALALLASVAAAAGAEPPKPWAADAFLPVTEERIAALPANEQPAWRAYWQASLERAKLIPARDLVDHSPTQPLAGPPIGASYSKGVKLKAPAAWYATEEARTIADHVVNWQTPVGGWVKSGDYARDRQPADDHHDSWSAGTFDNDSTIYELRFLALVDNGARAELANAAPPTGLAARAEAWRQCFLRGLDYSLAAQYPNGGFPQIYPLVGGYHDAITYNDDAMVHILELCRDIAGRKPPFAFVPREQAGRAQLAVERGVGCVLDSQLKTADGRHTVWGEQHDPLTLAPCAARNFEPVAECSRESVGLVQFLMSIPHPSRRLVAAVDDAVKWFPAHAFHGVVWNRNASTGTALVRREGAPDLWARFYEIGTGKPIFGERDRTIHYVVTELVVERRKGYGWFNTGANALPALYEKWQATLKTQG